MVRYPANPSPAPKITSSTEAKVPVEVRDYVDFLPEINKTEPVRRFFQSTVNQLLSSGTTETINSYWGKYHTRNYNSDQENYNVETDKDRESYQFAPGIVDKSTNSVVSYINTIKRMRNLDFSIEDQDTAFSVPGYTLDLPINTDMFTNYQNYYWLDGKIPVAEINATSTDTIDISEDIVGYDDIENPYTTPVLSNGQTLKFENGMRVKFAGDNILHQLEIDNIFYRTGTPDHRMVVTDNSTT